MDLYVSETIDVVIMNFEFKVMDLYLSDMWSQRLFWLDIVMKVKDIKLTETQKQWKW